MMTTRMSVTEHRWREGSGERYLSDGMTIRCQGVSKTRLRLRREELDNPDLTSDDVWPDLQCTRAAEPNTFTCKYHGGRSLNIRYNSILDFTPDGTMRDILDNLLQAEDYISRRDEIRVLQLREAQLMRELNNVGGIEAWESVLDAVDLIRAGDIERGVQLIQGTATSRYLDIETWRELRETIKLISSVSKGEVANAEKLQMMASPERVTSAFERIYMSIRTALDLYVKDEEIVKQVLLHVAAEIRKLTNTVNVGPS